MLRKSILAAGVVAAFLAAPAQAGLFGSDEFERPTPSGFAAHADLLARANASSMKQPASVPGGVGTEAALIATLQIVNQLVNAHPYVSDIDNYGVEDYWATPEEFALRGGDCEDFAIAKYSLLRSLGVPVEQMRVAIVQDLALGTSHAVLSVVVGPDRYILDNQAPTVLADKSVDRYRPVYSINEQSWWLHMPRQ